MTADDTEIEPEEVFRICLTGVLCGLIANPADAKDIACHVTPTFLRMMEINGVQLVRVSA